MVENAKVLPINIFNIAAITRLLSVEVRFGIGTYVNMSLDDWELLQNRIINSQYFQKFAF